MNRRDVHGDVAVRCEGSGGATDVSDVHQCQHPARQSRSEFARRLLRLHVRESDPPTHSTGVRA